MSGHSKWSTIKRAKGAKDAQRGAIFTKMSNLIAIAARKGSDPDTNFELRMAIDKAKSSNVPKDNIARAIKKGSGESGEGQIEELLYEATGPMQSQLVIKCLTDNRNRTASNVRHILSKYGGSLGAVLWNFEQQGVILIKQEELNKIDWDELELELIDQDVLDINKEDEGTTIYTNVRDLKKIKQFLETKNIATESAEVEYVAKEKKTLTSDEQMRLDKLYNALDENEDVSDYYTNIK